MDHIFRGVALQIMPPNLNQQGAIFKEYQNLTLVSYAPTLEREVEKCPEIKNITILHHSKRNYIGIYDSNNKENFPLIQDKRRTTLK